LGTTGACVAADGFNRMPRPSRVLVGNMLGGIRQIINFGNEDQKKRFLAKIAKGEIIEIYEGVKEIETEKTILVRFLLGM
jgi:alkylation response protein AidB-like acyl-CoA dehydrogenase